MFDTGTLFDGEQTTKLLFIVKVLDEGPRKILQFFKAFFPADFVNLGPETFLQQLQCAVQRCAAAGFLYKSAHLFTRFQQLSIVVQVRIWNHASDIVGDISLKNLRKSFGGEKFYRFMQQFSLFLVLAQTICSNSWLRGIRRKSVPHALENSASKVRLAMFSSPSSGKTLEM